MEHAVHKIAEMCEMAEDKHCGRAVRACTMMRRHKQVTMGMVMEHVRPFALSAAYCAGKGACHRKPESTLSEVVSGNEAHDLVLKHFDEVDWDEVLERAAEPEEEEVEELDEDEQEEIAEEQMQVCEARQENAMEARPHNFRPRCFLKQRGRKLCGL